MKRYLFLLITFFSIVFSARGTHIVGGEFEMIHLGGDTYLFRQVQYFDFLHGNPQAKDDSVVASIFRKSDDLFVKSLRLLPVEESFVPYSNPSCTDNTISTRRIIYETTLEIDFEIFNDPIGYYMVWERCCRNFDISNIVRPGDTGQTFYLEFPAFFKDGERFYNSTPTLFPPLQDYACVNQFYYADFKGFDRDGDSLVYSLVTPLNSSETNINSGLLPNPVPIPKPKPHPNITWLLGYNDSIQVQGSEPLNISSQGLLRVVPSLEGLFVFSVKCEEYRNGEKIGEVRRDFQLFVVDCPLPGNKPQIKAKAPGSSEYKSDIDNLIINYGDNSCFEIIVNDQDGNESLRIKALAINFNDDLDGQLSIDQGIITNPEDTLKLEFCLPQCINDGNFNPAIVDVLVYDNRCPQSLIDTLRISAIMNQPSNFSPEFVSPVQENISLSLIEGGNYTFPLEAIDADNDSILLQLISVDSLLENYGLELVEVNSMPGQVNYELRWNTDCILFDFSEKNHFEFMIIAEDYDECLKSSSDTIYYSVDIELPENNAPLVKIEGEEEDVYSEIKIEELRSFIISAEDPDINDQITLRAEGNGFNLVDLGIQFETQIGTGTITENFNWQIGCEYLDLGLPDTLEILFIVEDFDKCNGNNADTVRLMVKPLPPDNQPPIISINGSEITDTLQYIVGQEIEIDILSKDPNGDNVDLNIIEHGIIDSANSFTFTTDFNANMAIGTFRWNAICELLEPLYQPGQYTFELVSKDDKCLVPDTAFYTFTISISDIPVDYNFIPPNVFTPNAEDDLNREFYIPNLAIDNCQNRFEEIIIVNRWGQEIFRSRDRDFKWNGDGYSTGVYYYTLQYSNKTFKGIVSLLK